MENVFTVKITESDILSDQEIMVHSINFYSRVAKFIDDTVWDILKQVISKYGMSEDDLYSLKIISDHRSVNGFQKYDVFYDKDDSYLGSYEIFFDEDSKELKYKIWFDKEERDYVS